MQETLWEIRKDVDGLLYTVGDDVSLEMALENIIERIDRELPGTCPHCGAQLLGRAIPSHIALTHSNDR